jgi:ribosome-binding protein aMBF1 (putative translation factor)
MDDTRQAIARKIGLRLRTARQTRGIARSDLAAWAGMTVRQLQSYEAGHNCISVNELVKLAAILRLPVTHFLEACVWCGSP